jgi:hypothetical protein
MNKVLIVPVAWTTEVFISPKFIKIEFNQTEIDRLKRIQKVVKDEGLFCATIEFECEYFDDENCAIENTEFRSDVHQLRVYSNGVYFYAQHKHDAGTQFESDEFTIEEIEKA